MRPSKAISALAGTGSPVFGMLITSIWLTEYAAGGFQLILAIGNLDSA